MSTLGSDTRKPIVIALALSVGAFLALGFAVAIPGHDAAAAPSLAASPAASATNQWAFGGSAGASDSCSGSACGAGSTIQSLSLTYYVEWVVIYTATNISASQTEFEVQSALNASLSLSLKECANATLIVAASGCSPISASANLAGLEVSSGFTNVTNTGVVNLTAGTGAPANVAALAVMNAQSSVSFNFSGSFSEDVSVNSTSEQVSLNFDLGGSESSGITFSSPLGVVPIDVQPGDSWTASAPYSATGSYSSGYSLTATANGQSESENHWTGGQVSPSGTLSVNGTDLGAATLYDNYTSPATTVTAQEIALTFGTGEFVGTNGWLLLPGDIYTGASGALSGESLLAGQPAASSTAITGAESPYYQAGVGFVGESQTASASELGAGTSTDLSFGIQAGPEPVSVAKQQYSAITSSASSSSFPWLYAIVAVAVVVVVAVIAVFLVRARSRRGPPGTAAPPAVESLGAVPAGPSGGAPPSPGPSSMAPSMAAGASGAVAAPLCPTCGQPTTFMPDSGRFYCAADQRYV